jgi:hypothetical protein
LPSNDEGIFIDPLPSNDRERHRHTHIDSNVIS